MNGLPIRVMLVEDNPGDARLLHEMLHEPGSLKMEVAHFACMKDALSHLSTNTANVILLDLGLPDAEGLDGVRKVRTAAPGTPLVVLTARDDESLAVQALQEGAQDYLIKGKIESHALFRAVRYAIERQRMQVETDQARRLQLQVKDEFLSHVSHELRSPLSAIYQFGTILADGLVGGVTADQRECLQIILKNAQQLQSMIGDLLEVTRAQEGKLSIDRQCSSVEDAVAYTLKSLQGPAKEKGVAISFEPPPPLPLVYADPTRVRQILIILLDNAVKYTGPGGTVTVRTGVFGEDPSLMLVEVADTGCGINPDMTNHIFERLCQQPDTNQASRQGLGLGLYICKELVARQGGQIWVASSPKGSVFSLTLPIFSLAHILFPLLKNQEWPGDSVALVTVKLRSPDGWISKELREEWDRDARSLLQRCILDDLDVLLPRMATGGLDEVFQVIAFADEKGVAVLTKRIREQFKRLRRYRESGLIFSTSYRLSGQPPSRVPAPAGYLAGEMAARIEDLIKSESSVRAPY